MVTANPNKWLLFIDSDCELQAEVFHFIKNTTIELGPEIILAGLYLNPKPAFYFQKVQNWIANAWLRQSKNKNFLGGLFLIFSDHEKKPTESQLQQHFWGGEDKWLAEVLQQIGYKISLEEKIVVVHHTSKLFSHFLKRAWLHGRNEVRYLDYRIRFPNLITYRHWIQKIERSDWHLIPAIGAHFAIQKLAKLTQAFLRWNKKE